MININNFLELCFIYAERFFDEDVFAGFEGGNDLTGVEVVTGGDDDGINVRIVDNCAFVSGREFKTKLMGHMLGTNSRSRANTNKLDSLDLFHCGEKSAFCEFAGAEQADPNRRKA